MKPSKGRNRVIIENVTPQVDAGKYPVCRILGDLVTVSAAIFSDGHDHVAARLLYRHRTSSKWSIVPMASTSNDMWQASFKVDKLGSWNYTIEGWVDHFDTWTSDLKKRLGAQLKPARTKQKQADSENQPSPRSPGLSEQTDVESGNVLSVGSNVVLQDIPLALRSGAVLIAAAGKRARGTDAKRLSAAVDSLAKLAEEKSHYYEWPLPEGLEELVARYPDLSFATKYSPELPLRVDRERAQFSAWYELFPRSTASEPEQHGTFKDVEKQLPEIAAMGFDILYMPPIHPIGRAYRKGPNNSTTAQPGDHGSPWAIGDRLSEADQIEKKVKGDNGGHKSIHPQLGTYEDFDHLVSAAKIQGMELALDIAFQCSPDHPWVTEHPDWFIIRPDGTIQYAENPPKKYQDIYPLNFESPDWRELWDELYSVFEFWIMRGVLVFRVDNPHTKALPFWEWCLTTLQAKHPETIFLAEAFTRPHVMYSLAKGGFTQSYTYFTWRTAAAELQAYLEEITQPPVSDFFKPNFWPNTPDILHKSLQDGGRPAFMQRLILAATMTANYGIYGPAYELGENAPAMPAAGKTQSEEYMDSEKYEIRQRDRNAPGSLVPLITWINRIRHQNKALHSNISIHFHKSENDRILCYSKATPNFENTILIAINLDPFSEQGSWIKLEIEHLGLTSNQDFMVEDLLTGAEYQWHGEWNYVALKPETQPAHIFRVVAPATNGVNATIEHNK